MPPLRAGTGVKIPDSQAIRRCRSKRHPVRIPTGGVTLPDVTPVSQVARQTDRHASVICRPATGGFWFAPVRQHRHDDSVIEHAEQRGEQAQRRGRRAYRCDVRVTNRRDKECRGYAQRPSRSIPRSVRPRTSTFGIQRTRPKRSLLISCSSERVSASRQIVWRRWPAAPGRKRILVNDRYRPQAVVRQSRR